MTSCRGDEVAVCRKFFARRRRYFGGQLTVASRVESEGKNAMERIYTSVEEQVEYGLEGIDPEKKVEVSVKDLMYTYQAIGLLINFFHQPLHFPTLNHVKQFLGNEDEGALHLLWEVYYKRLYDIFPEDIQRGFAESQFDNPNPPYYYKTTHE